MTRKQICKSVKGVIMRSYRVPKHEIDSVLEFYTENGAITYSIESLYKLQNN